jgi:hypothetical protein
MPYTLSQPFDLGFLSSYVVGTGNTLRTGAGDVSSFGTTFDTATHYYSFAYAGGLSTVSISLTISPAQVLSDNVNAYEISLGEIVAVSGVTPLSSPTGIISVAGNIVGDGAQGNYAAGWTETITFQVANANPGRAVFEIDGGGIKGDDNGYADVSMTYRMSVDIKSEAPLYAKAADTATTKDGQLQLSNLLTTAQGSTYKQIQLWDSVGGSGGGFVVNGVQQSAGQEVDITQTQLASTSFKVGTAGGTDKLWVRVEQNDGSLTPWQSFTVTAPVDRAPIESAPDRTAAHLQSFAASSLFTASDPDGDVITKYAFWDSTGSGHFVVNGVAQAASTEIDITAAQLAQTAYQSGSGADRLWVRAYDGAVWGNWTQFTVTAPVDHAPVATAHNTSATRGQNIAASSLFSASDADGDAIKSYELWDSAGNDAGGHWTVGGVAQAIGQAIDVTAAQLSNTTFQSGSGSDHLWVRASDGIMWSAWQDFNVNAPVDHAPVVSASNRSVTHNQNIAASSLFSVGDADGDSIKTYELWDSAGNDAGGHWTVDGVAQAAGKAIDITPAQLSNTTFQSGSGSDHLWVRASDGIMWSAWQDFNVNAPVDNAPNVFGTDTSMKDNTTASVLNLFHLSDPDNDIPTSIQLWDSNASASSGHWLVGNIAQPAGQAITVDWTTYTSSTSFAAASTPTTDKIWERAFDGSKWSDWSSINVTSHA